MAAKLRVTVRLNAARREYPRPMTEAELAVLRKDLEAAAKKRKASLSIQTEEWVD